MRHFPFATPKPVLHLLSLALTTLTPLSAAAQDYEVLPLSAPLSLEAGTFSTNSPEAIFITPGDDCEYAKNNWGWGDCPDMNALAFLTTPETDTLLIDYPIHDGHLMLDDWTDDSLADLMKEIEPVLIESTAAQGERLGEVVRFEGWALPPTLDRENAFIYYATETSFSGVVSTNIEAMVLDRLGYVHMIIVPVEEGLSAAEFRQLVLDNLEGYTPAPGQDYASFREGDKVAEYGALGLVAAMFGLKFGKAALGGILAVVLAFGKKLIILVPLAVAAVGKFLPRLRGPK